MPARCSHKPCSRTPEPGFKTCDQCLKHNRAYKKTHQRRMDLKRKYGLSLQDYDDLLESQDGLCAICKRPPVEGRNLAVDHDHSTGVIRGLLCHNCNVAIGNFGESLEIIKAAVVYLERGS